MKERKSIVHVISLVEYSEDNSNDSELAQETHDNRAELKDNKLAEKFVSKNVIDLRLLKNFSVFKRT